MAIKRISVYPGEPEKDIYEITPTFQVFEEQTALVLDHLLDHIHFLWAVASLGVYSSSLAQRLAEFPQYGIHGRAETPERRVARILEDECGILLKYFVRICEAHHTGLIKSTPETRAQIEALCSELVSEMRERVPLLNADSVLF